MFNIDEAVVNFGKRIQEARLLRNITQDQLAEKCNVTPKHISAVERGSTPGSIILLLNICKILGISPNTLFIDTFPEEEDKEAKDNIIPVEKHDTFIKYARLNSNNQKFVDNVIEHTFDEQTRRS